MEFIVQKMILYMKKVEIKRLWKYGFTHIIATIERKYMILKYPEDIYPKEVLIKAAYHFLDRAYIHIGKENNFFVVSITLKEDKEPFSSGEFDNEMLVQAARYVVSLKTKKIREITIGRALASTIIEEKSYCEESEDVTDIDNILKDWFENE